jgi:hypothetical protein
MKVLSGRACLLLAVLLLQGCMTSGGKKVASKKHQAPAQKLKENYALMDDSSAVDYDIIRRGNKARGLDEY